ncbi:phage portal protein [Gleimia hominis]|uniref:Phage portal protein n=1 Tax=Gleimia hominis TaxID=595468 RepID=A0ABU3I9M8_9ACTO|nr:phage portal protein [Gleimia hominis]MDT3767084.1 phage portal protein [Gleimia hominis]
MCGCPFSCLLFQEVGITGFLYWLRGETKREAVDHAVCRILHDESNPEMPSSVFRETLMTHLLLWGNAFAQVIRNGRDDVIGLYPPMPNRMTVGRDEAGVVCEVQPRRLTTR